MLQEPFVLIVYGATGFTGKLVTGYLDSHTELKDKPWAIAGRTQSKLSELAEELVGNPKTICVNLEDSIAVTEMVKRTSVVINCAGPYSENNCAALLGACAREGVHYSDLAGEGFWQAEMVETFHEIAKNSGAKVILGGGVDSIPSDLGAIITADAFSCESNQKVQIRGVYTRYNGYFSGGTLNSARATSRARRSGKFTDAMKADPYLLAPKSKGVETEIPATPDGMAKEFTWSFDCSHGAITKFFMAPINARLVRRSLVLKNLHLNTSYSECASIGMWIRLLVIWISRGFGYFKGEPIKLKPISGEGPPSWLLSDGGFDIKITARTKEKLVSTTISGQGDPGYGATSKMLAELGLCLALDDHSSSSHSAGVLTPSTGLGYALVSRLSQARGGNFMQFNTIMDSVS